MVTYLDQLAELEEVIQAEHIDFVRADRLLSVATRGMLYACDTNRQEQITEPWIRYFQFFARRLRSRRDAHPNDTEVSYLFGKVNGLLGILKESSRRSISEASINLVREISTYADVLLLLQKEGKYGHIDADALAEKLGMSDRPLNVKMILQSMEAHHLIYQTSTGKRKEGKLNLTITFGPKGLATLLAALEPLPESEPTSVQKTEEDSSIEATASG